MVVEFYEGAINAQIDVWWEPISVTCPTATGTNWVGEYYASAISPGAACCRQDANLDFDWGTGSPAAEVPVDWFSARWTRTATFAAGTYRFGMNADDGVRLYVDGTLVKQDWASGASRYNFVDVPLTAGNHTIVLEYWEGLGLSNVDLTLEAGRVPDHHRMARRSTTRTTACRATGSCAATTPAPTSTGGRTPPTPPCRATTSACAGRAPRRSPPAATASPWAPTTAAGSTSTAPS